MKTIFIAFLLNVSLQAAIAISKTNYHGWSNSIVMSNGNVECIVVPAIGRIMQFKFVGEKDGPFWENVDLRGKAPNPQSSEWLNFGGDKTWPAPQSDWPTITPRAWPPPVAFDCLPVSAQITSNSVTIISPIDPHYKIQTERTIKLLPGQPKMSVSTIYQNKGDQSHRVSVWVITQLKDPIRMYVPIPANSLFPEGYNKQSDQLPPGLKREGTFLSLSRNRAANHKLGFDAGSLLWIGEREMVRMDSPRVAGAKYPDKSSSAEIYTNADPLAYVELEMLGPIEELAPGKSIERTCVYTLLKRSNKSVELDAQEALK